MDSSQKRITIVIPLYNEGEAFAAAFAEIRTWAEKTGKPLEFVFVDDGSRDGTWAVVERIAQEHGDVRALRFSRNFGKEAAMRAGLEHSRGDAVIVMDADLQHPPAMLPKLVSLWEKGDIDIVDVVKQEERGRSVFARMKSRLFNLVMRKLTGFDMTGASDYKLLDRRVVDTILSMAERQTFYRAMTEWAGFVHVRVPCIIPPREDGVSKWSTWKLVCLAANALTSFSAAPLHVVTVLGLIFLASSVVLALDTFLSWYRGDALGGFPTVVLLQLGIGSVLMLALGVIGEYLSIVFMEVKRRPHYVVSRYSNSDGSVDNPRAGTPPDQGTA